jgi:hypothetical protein
MVAAWDMVSAKTLKVAWELGENEEKQREEWSAEQ